MAFPTFRGTLVLVVTALALGACGSQPPAEMPTTAQAPTTVHSPTAGESTTTTTTVPSATPPTVPSTPGPSGGNPAPVPGSPSVPGPPSVPGSPSGTSSAGDVSPPFEVQKCVAFVTGPPSGVLGPATAHVRSTVPRTAVSITVQRGTATQQLTTETDDAGLAVQSLSPMPLGQTEQVAVTVGAAQCAATFPPR